MDLIERLFSIAPDNGDGTTELLWAFAVLFALIAAGFRREMKNAFRVFHSGI